MVGERNTAETNGDELLALMIGRRSAGEGVLSGLQAGPALDGPTPAYLVGSEYVPAAGALPTLELRSVTVANDRGALAVRRVSLDVMPGEVVGVAAWTAAGSMSWRRLLWGFVPFAKAI